MSKKVLVISSSPRVGGNSDVLADAFIKGAKESGHQVEKVNLAGKTIEFCRGCFVCQTTQRCVIRDDADQITQKMQDADVLVFATPIYYYEMSGQLKTMLDRGNPLYTTNYKFRDIYFLSAAAEDEESVPNRAVSGVEGWIECFSNAKLAGTVFAGGVTDKGDIKNHPSLEVAYEMGKAIN
ncbi:Iron-sulfur flavoprotein [Lachnospiraceae bacterium TWA4]|nr:Iron-sulfur flavoprotein [Lachnospiraceae bacterium TWA4]